MVSVSVMVVLEVAVGGGRYYGGVGGGCGGGDGAGVVGSGVSGGVSSVRSNFIKCFISRC